jgi:O-methyltransferase
MINSLLLKPFGLQVSRIKKEEKFTDDETFLALYEQCRPYTMTSVERMYALFNAVKYVVKNNIPGDFVECGVWRGGSSMMIALTLLHLRSTNRRLFLYDTFEGMSEPTEHDKTFRGEDADKLLEKNIDNKETSVWCLADINDVQQNMGVTKYPPGKYPLRKRKGGRHHPRHPAVRWYCAAASGYRLVRVDCTRVKAFISPSDCLRCADH